MGGWPAWFAVLMVNLGFRALARELRVESNYVIRHIETCPDVGYYFKRESENSLAAGECYLCFCQANGTAVCWPRDDSRCDVHKYSHNRARLRRSPAGLGDIFFRDAARDFFNVGSPAECKPFEGSFSQGCPPADWCTGCTICDCDANGHWDCHILSFCDGKETRTKVSPSQGIPKKSGASGKRDFKVERRRLPLKRRDKKTTAKPQINKGPKRRLPPAKPKKQQNKSEAKPSKSKAKPKNDNSKYAKKVIIKNKNTNPAKKPSPKVIKKSVSTPKPVSIQWNDKNKVTGDNESNEVTRMGQRIVKQVMGSVQSLVMKEIQKLNTTRLQRSVNSDGEIDYGEVKKKDNKMTYNKRSNAAARNKNKYMNRTQKVKHGEHDRLKRQILNETQAVLENVTIISLERYNTAVIPLPTTKTPVELTTPTNEPSVPTISEKDTVYFMDKLEKPRAKKNITAHIPLSMINFGKFYNSSQIYTTPKNILVATSNNSENNAEYNDIKFTKWYIIKVKQDSSKPPIKKLVMPTSSIDGVRYMQKDSVHIATTQSVLKNQNIRNGDENLIVPIPYTEIPKTTVKNEEDAKPPAIMSNNKDVVTKCIIANKTKFPNLSKVGIQLDKNITELQNKFKYFMIDVTRNRTTPGHPKFRVGIFRQLKTFFNKIFGKNKDSAKRHKYRSQTKEDRALQILCDYFGPCKINRKKRLMLKSKLKILIKETETIQRSINIIKGLLHLLELPRMKYNTTNQSVSEHHSIQDDVQKHRSLLKDVYEIPQNNGSLTETQLSQIKYIKDSTQVFIESINRFSNVLKEILDIIKKSNESTRQYSHNNGKDLASLKKIKQLLLKYNLIHNSFIKKMYHLIKGLNNQTSQTITTEKDQFAEVKGKYYVNDRVIIEHPTEIIESLIKLKNVAKSLNPRRKKRSSIVMRDDALEYLLLLMEYLMKKQHYPQRFHTENDGIDLIIDAIKNAPDIKPIGKKTFSVSAGLPSSEEKSAGTDLSETDESASISKRVMSAEGNGISQHSVKSKEDKVLDDPNWQVLTTERDFITATVYYKKFSDDNLSDSRNDISFENATSYSATKKHHGEDKEKVGFDKFESSLEDAKKVDLYSCDTDEDATTISSTTVSDVESDSNHTRDQEETNEGNKFLGKNPETSTQRSNISESESHELISDEKKTKLEWIEESFDKEFRDFKALNVTRTTAIRSASTSPKPKEHSQGKSLENVKAYIATSKLEKERRSKEMSPEDVMLKKQMEFLRSLDYVTDKSDFDETQQLESKDDGRSDDGEPNYFGL